VQCKATARQRCLVFLDLLQFNSFSSIDFIRRTTLQGINSKRDKDLKDSIERPSSPNPFSQGGRRGAGAQSEVSLWKSILSLKPWSSFSPLAGKRACNHDILRRRGLCTRAFQSPCGEAYLQPSLQEVLQSLGSRPQNH
jgi:hypothetical protein